MKAPDKMTFVFDTPFIGVLNLNKEFAMIRAEEAWHDEEVHDLVNYSDSKFETRIPCADDVLKLNQFIWHMRVLFNKKDKAGLVAPMVEQSWLFRVFHIGHSRPWEIEVPGDVVWAIVGQARQMLNDKCDYLAELCGYKRKED